jgi:hypothetical protein
MSLDSEEDEVEIEPRRPEVIPVGWFINTSAKHHVWEYFYRSATHDQNRKKYKTMCRRCKTGINY